MADDDEDYEGEEDGEVQPVMTWSGELVDFIPNGQGVAVYTNKDSYQGLLDMGKKQGHALYEFAAGARFEGEYVQYLREGWGTMTYPDSAKYEGTWENGSLEEGQWIFRDGNIYEETFNADSKPEGPGKSKFFSMKNTLHGQYTNGKLVAGSLVN